MRRVILPKDEDACVTLAPGFDFREEPINYRTLAVIAAEMMTPYLDTPDRKWWSLRGAGNG